MTCIQPAVRLALIADVGRKQEDQNPLRTGIAQQAVDVRPVTFVRCREVRGLAVDVRVAEGTRPGPSVEPLQERKRPVSRIASVIRAAVTIDDVHFDGVEALRRRVIEKRLIVRHTQLHQVPCRTAQNRKRLTALILKIAMIRGCDEGVGDSAGFSHDSLKARTRVPLQRHLLPWIRPDDDRLVGILRQVARETPLVRPAPQPDRVAGMHRRGLRQSRLQRPRIRDRPRSGSRARCPRWRDIEVRSHGNGRGEDRNRYRTRPHDAALPDRRSRSVAEGSHPMRCSIVRKSHGFSGSSR